MAHAGLVVATLLVAILTARVSIARTYAEVGAETDFAGSFARDATRILAGEAPLLQHHPPAYSMALAFGKLLAGELFAAALWISGISAVVLIAAGAFAFHRLVSPAAAWGVVVACACSVPFWTYASLASTDMAFAALISLALALLVEAMTRPRSLTWALAGATAAVTVLCRTNGIVCLAVVLVPLVCRGTSRRQLAAALAGFAAPVLCWIAYAALSGAPLVPAEATVNLAIAAYGGNGDAEEVRAFNGRFDGTLAILAHDPWLLTKNIGARLVVLPWKVASTLTSSAIAAFALAGCLLLARQRWSAPLVVYGAIVASTAVLTGLHPYFDRFYLFLLPALGALAALALSGGLRALATGDWIDGLPWAALSLLVVLGSWRAYGPTASLGDTVVHDELAEAVPAVRRLVEDEALLYGRKPFLGFAGGIERRRYLPDVATPEELLSVIETHRRVGEPAYVFIGSAERKHRPQLSASLAAPAARAWLEPVAHGRRVPWTLYRLEARTADRAPH